MFWTPVAGQHPALEVADLGDDQTQWQWWPRNFDLLLAYIPFARSMQDDLGLKGLQGF